MKEFQDPVSIVGMVIFGLIFLFMIALFVIHKTRSAKYEKASKARRQAAQEFITEISLTKLPLPDDLAIMIGRYEEKWNERLPNGKLPATLYDFLHEQVKLLKGAGTDIENSCYPNELIKNFYQELNAYNRLFLGTWLKDRYQEWLECKNKRGGDWDENSFWKNMVEQAYGGQKNYWRFNNFDLLPTLAIFQEEMIAGKTFTDSHSLYEYMQKVFGPGIMVHPHSLAAYWKEASWKLPLYKKLQGEEHQRKMEERRKAKIEEVENLSEELKKLMAERKITPELLKFIREAVDGGDDQKKLMLREAFDAIIMSEIEDKFFGGQKPTDKNELISLLAATYGQYSLEFLL